MVSDAVSVRWKTPGKGTRYSSNVKMKDKLKTNERLKKIHVKKKINEIKKIRHFFFVNMNLD